MNSGKVWTCNGCGKADVWGPTWSYFGNLEGPNGGPPTILFVACSPACMAKYKPGRCRGPREFAPGEPGPDGKAECPACGKRVSVTRRGRLARHKPDIEGMRGREQAFHVEELVTEIRSLLGKTEPGALDEFLTEAADAVQGYDFDEARLALDAASGAIEQLREKLDQLERGAR